MYSEQTAIDRIKQANEMSKRYFDRPLIVCYSGGKDSMVVESLAEKALGTDFVVQYNHTGLDFPEVVREIRAFFNELKLKGIETKIVMPKKNPWDLIVQKKYPPTRVMRYCCHDLKENNEKKTFICTGVRWAESKRRKHGRGIFETQNSIPEKRVILRGDNDDTRQLFESCSIKSVRCVNPIIDWTDDDVYDFIKDNNITISSVYKIFKRVGCIGCPQASKETREHQFEIYPKYKEAYLRAFDKMLKAQIESKGGASKGWKCAQDVFDYYMDC